MTYDDDDEQPAELGQANSTPKPPEDGERVGYKCPPKRTRFAKGKSGNPKGRPKGTLNLATIRAHVAAHWFEEMMKVTIGGRERKTIRFDFLLRKQAELAFKGDARAIKDCMDLIFRLANGEPGLGAREESAAEDVAIISTHLSMLQADVGLGSGVSDSSGRDDDD